MIYRLFVFIISSVLLLSTAGCNKELSEENGSTNFIATGSLKDEFGECLAVNLTGTFYNGVVAGSDTAYVALEVNVTGVGKYSISSDVQNGFFFVDSGFFNNTGLQTIRLKQVGAAILPIPTDFVVSFDTSICSFQVLVQDSAGVDFPDDTTGGEDNTFTLADSIPDNSWTFIDDTVLFGGVVDVTDFVTDLSFNLLISGTLSSSTDTLFTSIIGFSNNAIDTGNYTTNSFFTSMNFSTSAGLSLLSANLSTAPAAVVTFKVESYDSSTGLIKITFSGNALKEGGTITEIKRGAIRATIL
jgi:hypothetical protein